jgi:hypothetical protein
MHAISDTENFHSESVYMSSPFDQLHLPHFVGENVQDCDLYVKPVWQIMASVKPWK